MSVGKNFPAKHPFSRVEIFGAPYHGTVQGGVLTLPNATTKTYPQPGDTEPDTAGTVHLLKVPGIAEVARTEAQLAADDAAGIEWRNAALLSGHDFQLYGRPLYGWIYIDPTGDRWLVDIPTPPGELIFSASISLTLGLRFRRFGEYVSPLETVIVTETLDDIGQTNAPFDGFQNASGGFFESVNSAFLAIDGIYSDGSKVAFALRRPRPAFKASGVAEDVFFRHPLGWIQLAISGPGSSPLVTLSVLKTRDETLIEVDRTITDSISNPLYPAPDLNGRAIRARVGTMFYRYELLRLLVAWPDEVSGGWTFPSLRYVNTLTASGSVSGSPSSYTTNSSGSYECRLSIEVDGIEQSALSYTSNLSSSAVITNTGASPPAITWTTTAIPAESELIFQGTTYSYTAPGGYAEGNVGNTAIVDLLNYGTVIPGAGAGDYEDAYRLTWQRSFLTPTTILVPGIDNVAVDVQRYSLKALGFRYRVQATAGGSGDFVHMPRVTPSGVQGEEVTTSFSESARMYASWCPYSEVLTDIQTTPICWV